MAELDVDDVGVEEALVGLYLAMYDNQDFWRNWISDRVGPMKRFFAASSAERAAAKSLFVALGKLSDLKEPSGG